MTSDVANSEYYRTSATSLAKYRDCPKRWKEEPRTVSVASEKGTIFHEAMKMIHRLEMTPLQARKWAQDQIVASGMSPDDLKEITDMLNRITSKKYFLPEAENIIAVESDDGETILHGETAFEVPLPIKINGQRVSMSGKMDLVMRWEREGGILVRDYKTGFLDADEFQADYYALASYLKYWRTTPIGVQFVYARREFSPRPFRYEAADMPRILEYIGILASKMMNDTEFKPRLNSNCKTCALKMGCEAFLDAISKAPKIPEIDPNNWNALMKWSEHLSDVAKATTGLLDEVKKMSKEYLQKNKAADNGDETESYLAQQVGGYNYPAEKVLPLLEKYNLQWKPTVKLSGEEIKTIIESGIVQGVINEEQAKEIDIALMGKVEKLKSGEEKVLVPAIRTVSFYKTLIKSRKITETKA